MAKDLMSHAEFAELVAQILMGKACIDVTWKDPIPCFNFEPADQQSTLSVLSSWRLTGQDAMFGSGDDDPSDQDLSGLIGQTVIGVELPRKSIDLVITFSGGWILVTLNDAPGISWDAWTLEHQHNGLLVGGPGDDYSHFPPRDPQWSQRVIERWHRRFCGDPPQEQKP